MMTEYAEAERRRPNSGTVLGTFLYVWLMVGFFTGTVLLVGPMKWLTSAVRGAGWSQAGEDWAVRGVIVAYVVASVFLARFLVARLWRARTTPGRFGIVGGVTAAAALCLWAWMDPGRMLASVGGGDAAGDLRSASGAEFMFGAYPDYARLQELKREGVTSVISLQHPAVVPFEPRSIAEEKKNAAELGIKFIHVPMLPWVSDNAAAIARIQQIARDGHGKFYVHCGLGRDRTNVARRAVESMGKKVKLSGDLKHASTFADRTAPFEHGRIFQVERDVWLIPRPNAAEMAGYMEAGQIKSAVFLLDPADSAQAAWLAEDRRALTASGVAVHEAPLPRRGAAAKAQDIAAMVRTLPRPVAVIAPHTEWDKPFPGTEPADAFRAAYAKLVPPPAAPAARVATPSAPGTTTRPGTR
jgi:protein tyrosine phosphatase (PTP) superfamily phosphohydrolase (DUF442 family)